MLTPVLSPFVVILSRPRTIYKAGSLVFLPLIHFSTYLDVLLGTTCISLLIVQSTYLDVLLV